MMTKPVRNSLSFIILFSMLIISFLSVTFANEPQANIIITGTITDSGGGAVAGVTVGAWTPADEGSATTTDANGEYQLTMPAGEISMYVSPPLQTRLASKNIYLGEQNSSFIQDFALVDGYLVTGSVQLPNGNPPSEELWLGFNPLTFSVPDGEWAGTAVPAGNGQFQTVAPVGIYSLEINPPHPYYQTTQPLDLRHGDVTDIVLTLNDEHINSIPQDPPDASKITIGTIDSLGEASVTGGPGTFPPYSRVLLVNLRSNHQAHAIVDSDGSFATKIYAPPGSDIVVKYGPDEPRWHGVENGISESFSSLPGTIIHVPHKHTAEEPGLPFAAVGAVDFFADDEPPTRNYVGAAWAMTGVLSPVVIEGEWSRVMAGTFAGVEEPGLYLGGLNWTHPALVDLDGDDDLELVVGNENGRLTLYRNHGTLTTPDWQFETAAYANIVTEWWAYPSFADVTNDNLPDLFLGTEQGTVEIYYNEGTASQPVWPETPNTTLSVAAGAAPTLFNSDNDQDLDLLVGHEGGTLYHFENTGTLTNPIWTYRTDSYGGINEPGHGLQPSLVNLDGDSDLDLLIGRCGDLVWYRNNGPIANPTWTRMVDGYQGIGGSCAVSPGLGDWDNDTDLDLIIGHHWGELGFYRNDGPPSWTAQDIKFPFELLGDSAPALSDWDNDNDFDMLVGQAHGDIHQYTNVGTPTHPDWRDDGILFTLPWTNHPHAFPSFADIDDDDAPELFIGEGGWQGAGAGGNIHYYDNIGTPSMPNWTLVSDNWLGLDVGGWSRPTFIDINNDNDLDLFIGAEDGTLTYVENIGNPTMPNWATPVSDYAGLSLGEYSAPTFLDIDADDDFDMLVGLENGALAFVRNVGTINAPVWELVTTQYPGINVGAFAAPVAVDIDGDQQRDLLIGEENGGINLYLYEGVGAPPVSNAFQPGESFQITGTVHIHGPAIDASIETESIELEEWLNLMMLADKDGNPMPAYNSFMSSFLTPSGFPIQRTQRSEIGVSDSFEIGGFTYQGGNTVTADFTFTERIPESAPPGTYRPYIVLNFSGVPTNTVWLAANVSHGYTFGPTQAVLPPITIGQPEPPRLIWRLMMDDHVQGMRGTGARTDNDLFVPSSQIVTQGAPFFIAPVDAQSGKDMSYRLEPFLPMLSFTDRRIPSTPLIPFDLPGGQLCVSMQEPNGDTRDLGCEAFAQSFNRTRTTRGGFDLNPGTVQLNDVYSLKGISDRFSSVTFDQYGHYEISMTGYVDDVWGNRYAGGGIYDVWVAKPLDIDPGVLPGTPLAVDDAFNPTLQLYPRVPADVALEITHYPESDPAQKEVHRITGKANAYGFFNDAGNVISLTEPGEYRVDVTAVYTATDGTLYMGTMTWGSIAMTPAANADLIAHGRRGLDTLNYIPNHWFVANRDLTIPEGAIVHALNPYFNGDVMWSRISPEAEGGNALIMGASVQDTVGTIETAVQTRFDRNFPGLAGPGDEVERFSKGEIPLFTSTTTGRAAQLFPNEIDQIAYSYRSSQRPGVRIRELVAEDGESGGYWRLDTLYDDQFGVGLLGDQPNDFKFQYVGVVYRDLVSGHSEYVGQGTGWVFIPDDDPLGNRVMPPFAGPGNGGWTTEGGPLFTLKGEDIHIFIYPTGTQPGSVLQVGDTFHFAGHIMPTLNSKVNVTVTAPSGTQRTISGQANHIGYFYNPDDNFTVDEPGLWSVDVHVWHDGQCSGGSTIPPYPSGDVLGSENGRYWVYVVPENSTRLDVVSPTPGYLQIEGETVDPIPISGTVPSDLNGVTIDYTIMMPGYILKQGQVTPSNGTYQIMFDPETLQQEFPNLDLIGRDNWDTGLADTFIIGLLLRGQAGGKQVYQTNTITIQGEQVFVGAQDAGTYHIYLPNILK